MHGLTQDQTRKLVRDGFRIIEMVCGAKFEEVDRAHKGQARIEFHGNNSKMYAGKDDEGNDLFSLGRAWGSGKIYLNSDRDIPNLINRQVVQTLTQHEWLHTQGWKHTNTNGDVMHPNKGTDFFSPKEVAKLQKVYGRPTKRFHPIDRVIAGQKVKATKSLIDGMWLEWRRQTDRRTAIVEAGDWRPDHPLQPQIKRLHNNILKQYESLAQFSKEWHAIHKSWKQTWGVFQL